MACVCVCVNVYYDTYAYRRCRSADVDQLLHAILKARCKHIWVDCHKTLTLLKTDKQWVTSVYALH